MLVICVDFDGTMVNHVYPKVGEPAPGAIKWCKRFIKEGCRLILWTMRSGKDLEDAKDFFSKHNIPLWSVGVNPTQHRWTFSRKCYAHLYIDDAALGCPLIQVEEWERPCVDWETVGPMVMEMIEDYRKSLEKNSVTKD